MCQSSVLLARDKKHPEEAQNTEQGASKLVPVTTYYGIRDSAVRTAAGYVRFRGLITGRGKIFLSSAKCSDRVSDPLSLLFISQGVKFSWYETCHSRSSNKAKNKLYYRRTSTPAIRPYDMHRNDFA